MNYQEVRTAVKKKMLKEQELVRQKVLKAEAEKREQKRDMKMGYERAAVATEKRGRMQQLKQKKATKEEMKRK